MNTDPNHDFHIPDKIRRIVGDSRYTENHVGQSDSHVLIFPEHVLKIQQRTVETDNEHDMSVWLRGKLCVPEIQVYLTENGTTFTLMSRAHGKMLCDEMFLRNPETLLDLTSEALRMLWNVDITECPYRTSRLEERLKAARYNVESGLVDMDNVEPETFGDDGFRDPEELLEWLEQNQPEEDLVLTHGDFCLPNIFAENGKISAFIDLGKIGPADRWQDLAIVMRSLKHNLHGVYSHGKKYADINPQMLLDRLGIPMNDEKNRYYMLLDELF